MQTTDIDEAIAREVRIRNMIADNKEVRSSFYLQQALTWSLQWADKYTKARSFEKVGITPAAAATLAMARLEWVLQAGRFELNGKITTEDFVVLCNTFQGEIALPEDFDSLASPVADDNGLEWDTYKESPWGPLIDKLANLTVLQRVALRDLVERYWYVGQEYASIEAFLNANGIETIER